MRSFPLPRNLSFEQAAGIGVAYITAWTALVNAAQIQAGETTLIIGTTGAVGSAAARIAHQLGARVIGTARSSTDIPAADAIPVDDWVDLQLVDLPTGVRSLTKGRGVDVALDVVGGPVFEQCLATLAWRGRQVAISSGSQPQVSFNLVDFYHNESRLLGVDTLKLSFEETAEILRQLTPGIESGTLQPPRVEPFPLEEGPKLYRQIADAKMAIKPVLIP